MFGGPLEDSGNFDTSEWTVIDTSQDDEVG